MIQFDNVTATYKKNIGIFNISFKVKKGDMVFIMGPTGAGKSTILKTIYKDMFIDSGKIILDKEDISSTNSNMHTSSIRRDIGMIFQDFKLLEDRTVFENIALPLRIEGYSEKQTIEAVKEFTSYAIGQPMPMAEQYARNLHATINSSEAMRK